VLSVAGAANLRGGLLPVGVLLEAKTLRRTARLVPKQPPNFRGYA
jgi:hypothetical protein